MSDKNSMVDLGFLRKFTNSDTERMKKYIQMYLNSSIKQFNSLKVYRDSKNWDSMATLAHSLKPQIEYMGITGMKEMLIEIIDIARNQNDKSKLQTLVDNAIIMNEKAVFDLEIQLLEL